MSRRRGEFEHRTSIFEGAFRAWSHLGGLEPSDLEDKGASDLDPLTNPLENDERLKQMKSEEQEENGEKRRLYPYEPLPRSGLAHPFVQAILSPWLGPDADQDAIQLGLTTLRTWWQHRRKGESGSAIAALGSDKMRGVVEGYTRHFFNLAHCLVTNDKEQPPRTLHTKMKEIEKVRSKRNKKRAREEEAGKLAALALNAGLAQGLGTDLPQQVSISNNTPPLQNPFADTNMTPLERLHAAQRRQLAEAGGVSASFPGPILDMKGKCMPGKLDLPEVVGQVSAASTQLAHRGALSLNAEQSYGDPNTTPVVFVSGTGDIQIAMRVDGITCAHCVKIVETVLRGCNGNKSPIDGLLDAAADRTLNSVLIKIDKSSNAKRIAFEAARNLKMVGYTAKSKEMSIQNNRDGSKAKVDLGLLSTAFDVVAATEAKDVFDWKISCTCPDNGILRSDCARHSQMNTRIFDAFDQRELKVTEYMAGCAMKYGMDCTCGPNCTCKNCMIHNNRNGNNGKTSMGPDDGGFGIGIGGEFHIPAQDLGTHNSHQQQPIQLMNNFMGGHDHMGMEPQNGMNGMSNHMGGMGNGMDGNPRGNSIISFRGSLGRHLSVTSDATFGRAMSSLSALSIDWENMEDFDVTVDHSAHINANEPAKYPGNGDDGHLARGPNMKKNGGLDHDGTQNTHVSFKV